MGHSSYDPVEQGPAWNAGKKLGAKRPLKPKEIWEIRFMLDREHRLRDRALFDLAIDSKLRDPPFPGFLRYSSVAAIAPHCVWPTTTTSRV